MQKFGSVVDRFQLHPTSFAGKLSIVVVVILIAFATRSVPIRVKNRTFLSETVLKGGNRPVLLFSGVPLNWSSLVVVLKGEGIYSELCTNSTVVPPADAINTNSTQPPTCAAQDLRLNLVYSVSLLLSYALIAVQGFVMDWRGPRLIFMVGAVLYFFGTVAFSLAYPGGSFDGVFVGQVLLSVGAPPIFTALMWFSTLFPEKMPTINALLNTTFDASVIVYHLFNIAWTSYGITHNTSFRILLAIAVGLLGFAVFWPRGVGPFSTLAEILSPMKKEARVEEVLEEVIPEPNYKDIVPPDAVLPGEAAVTLDEVDIIDEVKETKKEPIAALESLTFVQQVQQPECYLFIFFHLSFIVWQLIYMGTVERRAAALSDSAEEAEYYVQAYGWILSSCFVLAPPIGYMIEKIGVARSFAVEHAFCLAWLICLLFNDKSWQIPSFILFGITRAIYYSLMFLYIFRMWGPQSLGSHLSLLMGPVGVLTLFQYPILKYVEEDLHGDWLVPTQWMFLNIAASTILPVYLYVKRKSYAVEV